MDEFKRKIQLDELNVLSLNTDRMFFVSLSEKADVPLKCDKPVVGFGSF